MAFEISEILDCGLDKKSIAIVLELLKQGVHPSALANVINAIRSNEQAEPEEAGH